MHDLMACILSSINTMNHSLQVQSGPRRLLTTMQALLSLLLSLALPGHAITTTTTYTLPADLTSDPFNCTMATATSYNCASISLDKDALLELTSNVTISVTGDFTSAKNLATSNNGHTFQLTASGDVSMRKDTDIDMSITALGAISFAKNTVVDGNLKSGGDLTIDMESTINGNVTVGGNLDGAKDVVINGICMVTGSSNVTCSGVAALDHVRATTTGTATTCSGTSITVTACSSADSNGSCTAYTGGISGTVTANAGDGTNLTSVAFSIASGNSSTTVTLPTISTAQTASLSFTNLSKSTSSNGICWNGFGYSCNVVVGACGANHVRLSHAGTGVTCVPSTVTVYACSDADVSGSCTANTAGIAGNVVATGSNGSQVASAAFTIPSGSSSVSVSIPVTTAQTVTFSTSGLSPTPSGSPQTTCWNGSSASCSYIYADSGFIFDVGDHQAGNIQNVTMQAVKKSDSSSACTPTLTATSYTLTFSCNYTDPANGSKNVTVADARNTSNQVAVACNTSGSPLSVQFGNLSKASLNISYPDAGKVTLSASYTNNGVTIYGNDTFVAAPTKFVITTPTSLLQADVAFNATVTAVNSSGGTMPNFGQESGKYRTKLTLSKCGGVNPGAFGGTLSSAGVINMPSPDIVNNQGTGISTATGLKYSEVGTLDATVVMTDSNYASTTTYLGYTTSPTGATSTGSCTGGFGTFQPAYFTTVPVPALDTKWAYSGVPFTVRVTAKNGSGNTVTNYTYDSNVSSNTFSKAVTLSAINSAGNTVASTVGTLTNGAIAAKSFASGVADDTTTTFTFPAVTGGINGTKLAPQKIYLRATDANATQVTSALSGTNPSTHETSVEMRYGRLRLFNAYGASLSLVKMPFQAEYWNGSTWVVNGDDSTTNIPATAFGFPATGNTASVTVQSVEKLASGKGTVTLLNTNNNGAKGYADIAVNLGSTNAAVNSCLSTDASGTTAANLLGLRSYQGSKCKTTDYTYDPSARAYFGIQSQETKGVVHVREVFN